MPIYVWECEKCNGRMEKLIGIGEYDRGEYSMEDDEATTIEGADEGCEHSWKRRIESGIRMAKAFGWGPGKGSW